LNASAPRVRRPITALQDDYRSGHKEPLEKLWRAWKGIQERDPDDSRSFFRLAGYHGQPFRGAGWGTSLYWGGYCNHGNVLFPTWHRAYLFKLEQALQSIPGCDDVMLPYWDETSQDSLNNGIPWALTDETVTLDRQVIDNPLRSFRFTAALVDHVSNDAADYSKPKGYVTQRYPRSGLVGSDDRAATEAHNLGYVDHNQCVSLLNDNVVDWLDGSIVIGGQPTRGQVATKYRRCLEAPNYTVFSNMTSASEWNVNNDPVVVSLESPHNAIHLAVGGFEVPGRPSWSPISGANGDMGENDTAGFDPIFFFHHCFVDYVFWTWQQDPRHPVEIIAEYPGTNSVDGQNPTPGVAPNSWLDLDSPLYPFRHKDDRLFTSRDCLDTEKDLGYTYSSGSLTGIGPAPAPPDSAPAKVVTVSGINRAPAPGSFLVSVYANVGDQRVHLGTEAVLSRWNTQYCANCQTHLEVTTFVEVPAPSTLPIASSAGMVALAALPDDALADPTTYDVIVTTHDGEHALREVPVEAVANVADDPPAAPPPLLARARLEVR
jgi:tyrosinase